MERTSSLARVVRGILLLLVGLFFLFPIAWVFLMSWQTNNEILRIPPSPLLHADRAELRGTHLGQAP